MRSVRPAPDASAGAYFTGAAAASWELLVFGPPGLDVHLRIAFADDEPTHEQVALEVLAQHTGSPQRCYAAVWEGWTRFRAPAAPSVLIGDRRMLLFEAQVEDLYDVPSLAWSYPGGQGPAPHLAWPADHAWCLACDVDEEDEFSVGCDARAAAALTRRLAPHVRQVRYGEDLSLR